MEKTTDLRNLQLEELKILDEFVRVCEENNLRYFSLEVMVVPQLEFEV